MVKRYSHLAESHTASVVERMNEKLFECNRFLLKTLLLFGSNQRAFFPAKKLQHFG